MPLSVQGSLRYLRTVDSLVVDREGFSALFGALTDCGYLIIGPTVRDDAIVYEELASVEDLPIGWTDEQEAGTYRLRRRDDGALFGYAVGPHSWKKYLFPPRQSLWNVRRENGSLRFVESDLPSQRMAFLGVRACELAAMAVQDKVFLESGFVDRSYLAARSRSLIVGVNCSVAGGTCFCVSMGTGPSCESGFDLVITELIGNGRHDFLLRSATEAGEAVLVRMEGRPAVAEDQARATLVTEATAARMGRELAAASVHDLLLANLEHPRWDDVASRCLACTNCTLVCPTCFCSTTEDGSDLSGDQATRSRRWDSCFTLEFSGLHQTPVRSSVRARYRQWLTHKLATWHDQFGTSGCVGCGRCITWCPVGIDLTEEVAAIAEGVQV